MTNIKTKVNIDSFEKTCGGIHEILLYGMYKAGWNTKNIFERTLPHVKWYYYNDPLLSGFTYDGIPTDVTICKAALTSVVLENYIRIREKRPLIQCIFLTEYDDKDNPDKSFKPSLKAIVGSEYVTSTEIKRCYHMLRETEGELNKIVKDTFKFVKLTNKDNTISFAQIKAPWENPHWTHIYNHRHPPGRCNSFIAREKKVHHWKDELQRQIADYDEYKTRNGLYIYMCKMYKAVFGK